MKKTFTILIAAFFAIFLINQSFTAKGQTKTAAYTLDFTTNHSNSGNNHTSYTGATWTFQNSNSNTDTWTIDKAANNNYNNDWAWVRFGGKGGSQNSSTTTADSYFQSTFSINSNVDKVTLNGTGFTTTTTNTFHVNSIKLQVSSNSTFTGTLLDEVTKNLSNTNSEFSLEFEPTEGTYWASGAYYKVIINWYCKGKSNHGVNITTVVFEEYVVPGPSITADDVNIAADILAGNISYDITNPDGSTLTALKKSGDWLTVGDVDAVNKKVAFTATENTTASSRPAVVTLTYGTATKDVTITQTAAAPKYAVTFSAPSNGTLVIKRDETTLSSGNEVPSGTTLTVLATPASGYNLVKWEYSTNGGSTWSDGDGTSYTITSAVQFRASFVAKVYHTITYSVNGTETEVAVEDGQAISFAAPASGIPSGYTFTGWSASSIATYQPNETGITYISTGNSTHDDTYYAVMACEGSTITVTLSATHTSATTSYDDNEYTDDKGTKWSGNTNEPYENSTARIGLRADGTSYLESPTFAGNVKSIKIMTYNGSSRDDRTFYLRSTKFGETADLGTVAAPKGVQLTAEQTAVLTGTSFKKFYIDPSGAVGFSYIKVVYAPLTNYCTTINNFTNTNGNNWNTNGNWSWGAVPTTEPAVTISAACTIPSGTTANVNNIIIADGGSLTIANGGQLITANPVTATVQKTINAPTGTWGQNDNTGWHAISSPIGNINSGDISSTIGNFIVSGTPYKYDFYRYQEDYGWKNYNNNDEDFGFVKGCGYLYARYETKDISFTGSVTTDDFSLTGLSKSSVKHSGLHLIGNPYTHTIYYGVAIDGDISDAGYYKLNSTGSWISTAAGTAIDPMEAIFVFVTNDEATISFTNDASAPALRANHDFIQFTVANSQYEDVAYAMFDKGNGLSKIEHRNSEAPMIYIPQNDDNYAIAMMNDNTQMFGLNFKAATTGKYTLSYNTKGDYSYLHLIDRLTGEDIDMLIDNEYSFIGSPIDGDNRFIVKLTYNSGNEVVNNDIFAYQSGSDIIVNGEGELQVFDVTGRRVMTTTINGVETINVPTTDVYIFRLIGNEVKTQKIVVR